MARPRKLTERLQIMLPPGTIDQMEARLPDGLAPSVYARELILEWLAGAGRRGQREGEE